MILSGVQLCLRPDPSLQAVKQFRRLAFAPALRSRAENTIQRRRLFHNSAMSVAVFRESESNANAGGSSPSAINHVSDTALLVAGCRAVENDRPDALARDPFAARLAGERGIAMFRALLLPVMMGFGIAVRTRFIDELLLEALAPGDIQTVICLGSGLDTRPWRLELPPHLRWIEVDFPDMLDYKETILAGEKPRCRRERHSADLNDPAQRASVYAAVGRAPALMITEGLLMYLSGGIVRDLAAETARESSITHWIAENMTSTFSAALGVSGSSSVRHVQADDHLPGEEIIQTICANGWQIAAHRSYIRDLGFAAERIQKMTAAAPTPPRQPNFAPDEPAGVHRFVRKQS